MYTLQAVIGFLSDLENVALPSSTAGIPLTKAIGLIPLTNGPLNERGDGLSSFVSEWIAAASVNTTPAYIGAEYFGGSGGQSSIVCRDGRVVDKPRQGTEAINEALQMSGVSPTSTR